MDSPREKKQRKSVYIATECVMHTINVTIAEKENIIQFSEQSFLT